MKYFLPIKKGEAGMTLVEVMISAGILGIITVGFGLHMKSVKSRLNAVRGVQGIDVLEQKLINLLSHSGHIKYSSERARGDFERCLSPRFFCRDGFETDFDFYLDGTSEALTGHDTFYSVDGELCDRRDRECRRFIVQTKAKARCLNDLGPTPTCVNPSSVTTEYRVVNIANNKVIRRGFIEMIAQETNVAETTTVGCPPGFLLRGIGFSGGPLCTPIAQVRYADAESFRGGALPVSRRDCRPKQRQTVKVKVLDENGNEVEIDQEVELPINGSDVNYVSAISRDGQVVCAQKFW